MKPASRAVLDTYVVLSALVFPGGQLARLRAGWQQARFVPLVSKATAGELVRALAYPKFKLTADDQRELLGDYLPYCMIVAMSTKPPRVPPCRDPFAAPFLQLALAGAADHLVTGDKDLLGMQEQVRCRIVAAAEFLSTIERP